MQKVIEERIRKVLRSSIEQGKTAGANLLVLKDGKEMLYMEEGMADREAGKEIRRDTIFRLYSMSKPVTAAAVMILVERGELDLLAPVSDYLPEYAKQYVEANGVMTKVNEPMKIIHLMNMTSGLAYGGGKPGTEQKTQRLLDECIQKLGTEDEVTTLELASRLGHLPLMFAPGCGWNYGLSADVLGAVIEQVSGMRFGEFLEKELFAPLGMKDTGFWVPKEKQDRLARVYSSAEDGSMELYTENHLDIRNSMDCPPAFESGGAGLVSTVDDYAKFAQMLQNGGILNGVRILSEQTVQYLTAGKLSAREQQDFDATFGLGLPGHTYAHLMRVLEHPSQAAILGSRGEYGWDGWLGCYFANLPERNMTILLMQQKKDAGTTQMTRRIRNLICSEND